MEVSIGGNKKDLITCRERGGGWKQQYVVGVLLSKRVMMR
jgi:hypothetical protein